MSAHHTHRHRCWKLLNDCRPVYFSCDVGFPCGCAWDIWRKNIETESRWLAAQWNPRRYARYHIQIYDFGIWISSTCAARSRSLTVAFFMLRECFFYTHKIHKSKWRDVLLIQTMRDFKLTIWWASVARCWCGWIRIFYSIGIQLGAFHFLWVIFQQKNKPVTKLIWWHFICINVGFGHRCFFICGVILKYWNAPSVIFCYQIFRTYTDN